MPSKNKDYDRTIFPVEVIKKALSHLEALPKVDKRTFDYPSYRLCRGNERWHYDTPEEFFAEYRKGFESAKVETTINTRQFCCEVHRESFRLQTTVSVSAENRETIESVFDIFEQHAKDAFIPQPPKPSEPPVVPRIFIGHGKNTSWRELKDHLQDKHGFKVEAYEVGARAGHTIRDILEEMLTNSSMAFLVLTGEDELVDGTFNARPNVVHETGLFQGRLGFSRAIVLLEEGTKEFSNLYGIQQLRFAKEKIREVFGDVVATIRREFPHATH